MIRPWIFEILGGVPAKNGDVLVAHGDLLLVADARIQLLGRLFHILVMTIGWFVGGVERVGKFAQHRGCLTVLRI